ncbi:MAG: AAA family ATPase [Spirochaetaceae bacterium]|nr:AAA family ATPase [Spirochaetaceae bacterium]
MISQKGGAGKTTCAVGLAVAHELAGGCAVVVDLDPQGSTSVWGDLRAADRPAVVAAHAPRLRRLLEAARVNGADLAVIDTAPHASEAALAAARAADVVLVPCRCSVADLHAIGATLDICEIARVDGHRVAGPLRTHVVLNAVPARGQLAEQARQAMADRGAAVAPVLLHQRIAHVHAFTAGQTAQESEPESKAAAELAALYRWTMEGAAT